MTAGMNKKLKNLVFILVLGSICIGLLLGLRGYTLPIIKRDQEITLKRTILTAAGIDYAQGDSNRLFEEKIRKGKKGGFAYYISPDGEYIFEFKGRGLWGMIEGVITLGSDLTTIKNIQILSQEETPGLGGRIGEKGFLDGFKDKKVLPRLLVAMRKKATKNNEIDAITGATLSTDALIKMVNDSVENFRKTIENIR